ncbi:MAG: hypothetical protein WAM41_10310 [Psychrobacillus psychrotolerans]|uniref:hypothetical protein n=1 Tax=Psychrobacillus psychrotolerans TaxID=126156 RepID=UPI00334DEE56
MLNGLLDVKGGWIQSPEGFLWFIFSPMVFAIGVPWREAVQAGFLNEFVPIHHLHLCKYKFSTIYKQFRPSLDPKFKGIIS